MSDRGASAQWYVARGGAQHGPVSESEIRAWLQSRHIGPDDHVWCPDFTEWKRAGEVFAQPLRPPPMPPAPSRVAEPQPAQIVAPKQPKTVLPTYEVETIEKGDAIELLVRSKKMRSFGLAMFGGPLLGTFGVIATIGGYFTRTWPVIHFGLLLLGLTYSCIVLGRKKYVTRLRLDPSGITLGRKTYAYEHVASYGWDSHAKGQSYSSVSIGGPAAQAGQALGNAAILAAMTTMDQIGCYLSTLFTARSASSSSPG